VCGRPLCCNTWLREFEPITLKMARDQHLALSPSKLSGACGRLKCCVRYELEWYREEDQLLPKPGQKIPLDGGTVVVSKVDRFRGTVTLRDSDGHETTMGMDFWAEGDCAKETGKCAGNGDGACGDCTCGLN
jgi:cell fate regulator YaaT (PSP1 superfamily)